MQNREFYQNSERPTERQTVSLPWQNYQARFTAVATAMLESRVSTGEDNDNSVWGEDTFKRRRPTE
jgi:hypothetical protein